MTAHDSQGLVIKEALDYGVCLDWCHLSMFIQYSFSAKIMSYQYKNIGPYSLLGFKLLIGFLKTAIT